MKKKIVLILMCLAAACTAVVSVLTACQSYTSYVKTSPADSVSYSHGVIIQK